MGIRGEGQDTRGAVMICVVSPTRMVLVKDKRFPCPRWKLPGGGIEPTDIDVISAAIRECQEETGLSLALNEVSLHSTQIRKNGSYRPHLCIAEVTEEKLDTRVKIGNEDGRDIMVGAFDRDEVPTMVDLLQVHRGLVNEALASV